MKITVVSDLHLEFSDCYDIKNEGKADVLVLSGDIVIAQDMHDHPCADFNPYSYGAFADLGRKQQRVKTYRDFLKRMSFMFPHVVYVAGNHEFYHGKWVASIQHLRDECAQFPNVHVLEKDSVTIDDTTFVGGTLWTNMNKMDPLTLHSVRDLMNDYRIIRNDVKGYTRLKPADTVIRHRETLDYIRSVVEADSSRKYVVVGHHGPSFQSVHPFYAGDTVMNGAYHSDLSEFILDHPQIKLWTHGHTHHTFDYAIGETRIVCNPRGYHNDGYSEDTGWDPNLIVEV